MFNNIREVLYIIDIIGPSPTLLIKNNERYKSLFSSIFSLIIIILIIFISIFLLIEFLKYDSPIITYSKANDNLVNRAISIKDSFLIFQLVDSKEMIRIDNSLAFYEAEYSAIYDDGNIVAFPLKIEKCEFGKNLNIKYQRVVREKYKFERNIEDFYCISNENNSYNLSDISLFYFPNVGYSNIHLKIKLRDGVNLKPENIQTIIANENTLIDHNNKSFPMRESFIFYLTSSCSSFDYTVVNYNFQYIQYDSDEGLFFKKSYLLNGMSFSDMSIYRNRKENHNETNDIGVINLGINKSYYDFYQRSYKKLQSLLAEIMSIISLIIEIARIIGMFLLEKRMSYDIMNNLLKKTKNNEEYKNNISNSINNKNFNKKNNNKILSQSTTNNNLNFSKNTELNLNSETNFNDKILDKTFESINYFHLIKSYLCCFKDKKTKLINHCHKIINDDLCIENILEKFYISETINNYFLNKKHKKIDYIKCNKFKIIEHYVSSINEETKKIINDAKMKKNKINVK